MDPALDVVCATKGVDRGQRARVAGHERSGLTVGAQLRVGPEVPGDGHDCAGLRGGPHAQEKLRVLTVGDGSQRVRGRTLERRIKLDLGQRRCGNRDHDRVSLDLSVLRDG